MAQPSHNFDYTIATPGECDPAGLARKARFYRAQIWLAAVVGMLTLSWVLYASPRQEVLLKSIQAQTIAAYDEIVTGEVCEMSNGKSLHAGKACCNEKFFKAGCSTNGKRNSAKDVITCLIRRGATKLQAALS